METSLVEVNGTEVSAKDSGKTVVNINICQESSLSYLVKAVTAAGRKQPGQKAPAPKTPDPSTPAPSSGRAPCTGEQKVLGGVQILLGIVCIGLRVVLFLLHDHIIVRDSWAPFWMGSLFVVSGSLCVLSERRGGRCWVLLATLFNLASVVAGCVGLALGIVYMPDLWFRRYWIDDACMREAGYTPSGRWRPTWSPNNFWSMERCRSWMMKLLNVFTGVEILLLIFTAAATGIAVFCFGYGLRVLCCTPRADSEDYLPVGDPEGAGPEVPPPYEEPTKENMAA
ncbi:transmembrane protein 176A-like [Heteronotia binoei]|uniref:transmembrane protein 176A-like n=1 Tax=Heteronotia binoei TaxID=13085 RepID=UPI00293035DD|nr:transmembrane protein 176A-like [Heteronotia binoei]